MTGGPLRIGIVCPYSLDVPGGVQSHVLDLARALVALGHTVSVLAPADDERPPELPLPAFVTPAGRAVSVPYNGSVARLTEPLMHNPVSRLEDALSRMDRYSTAGAEQLVMAGKRVTFMSGIFHGLWTFLRLYLLRGGFLDGREGFLLAVANAEGTYYRYMKAWLRGRTR